MIEYRNRIHFPYDDHINHMLTENAQDAARGSREIGRSQAFACCYTLLSPTAAYVACD